MCATDEKRYFCLLSIAGVLEPGPRADAVGGPGVLAVDCSLLRASEPFGVAGDANLHGW
jgi:hypothetical protein